MGTDGTFTRFYFALKNKGELSVCPWFSSLVFIAPKSRLEAQLFVGSEGATRARQVQCAACESFTTIELKINFFRPVWEARLRAEGKVVRRGNIVGYIECEITDEAGHLVAKSSSTCMVLRGDRAKGR